MSDLYIRVQWGGIGSNVEYFFNNDDDLSYAEFQARYHQETGEMLFTTAKAMLPIDEYEKNGAGYAAGVFAGEFIPFTKLSKIRHLNKLKRLDNLGDLSTLQKLKYLNKHKKYGFDFNGNDIYIEPKKPSDAPDWIAGRRPEYPPDIYIGEKYVKGGGKEKVVAFRHPETGDFVPYNGAGNSKYKGNVGEMLGTENMKRQGHEPVLDEMTLDGDSTLAGIDQIYKNANEPPPLILAETKMREGKPVTPEDIKSQKPTKDYGPQTSTDWTENHADILHKRGDISDEIYRQIKKGDYEWILQQVDPTGSVTNVPIY